MRRDPPVTEEPLGGWGPLQRKMDDMEAAADAIIARAGAAPGNGEARYRTAEMEIYFAMRPEFGPANAALPRERKLELLARAVGLPAPPEPATHRLDVDGFVADVRAGAARLRAAGLDIDESPVRAGTLLWSPGATIGWQLVARDRSRTVAEQVPYAAPTGAQVTPSVSLCFFPLARMSAEQGRVRREQPGYVVGALSRAVVLRLQSPQSHDQDPDGRLGDGAHRALFPDGDGLARASGGEAPADAKAVPGAHALLWTNDRGATVEHVIIPLAR